MKNRKGIAGIETVQAVIVLLLILAVAAIAMFLGLNAVIGSNSALADETVTDNNFINQTIRLNHSATSPTAVDGKRSVVLSNVIVTNATSGKVVSSGNYTISAGTLVTTDEANYNNSLVNVSASYTYLIDAKATMIVNNITNGTTSFFTNIPTVMVTLGAVTIILIVLLILYAVRRFEGGYSF